MVMSIKTQYRPFYDTICLVIFLWIGALMNKKTLYQTVYNMLGVLTPLPFDCGTLCQSACCQGDTDSGMYLFPGEEILLRTAGFICISPTDLEFESGRRILLATCPGQCERSLRPLSCRIFPLTPYLTPEGRLDIRMDPRANSLCPLARNLTVEELNPDFFQAVEGVCRLILDDEDGRDFISCLSQILDESDNSDFLGLL